MNPFATATTSDLSGTVTDPVKYTDKYGQAFICYKVNSQSTRTGFELGTRNVERRFNDFTWLSQELSYYYPGCIVPALPDKQAIGRFSQEFVESRRRGLERFLQRVICHSELGYAEVLKSFLQDAEDQFTRKKEEVKASKPKLATTAMAWFEGTVTTLAHGKPELEKSAADLKIEDITQYVNLLEKQMANVSRHAEALVKANKETSKTLFDVGQSISYLGQAEGESIGTALTTLGSTFDALSVQASGHVENEQTKFLEPLEEYERLLASIKLALGQRSDKKNAYVHAVADYEAKTAAHRKLAGAAGKEAQARQKEQAAQLANDAMNKAQEDLEKVTERFLTEFETFKAQKAHELKEILVTFVSLQIEHTRKVEEGWKDVLPKISSTSVPPHSNAVGYALRASMPAAPPPPAPAPAPSSGYPNHPNHYGQGSNFSEHNEDDLVGASV